MRTRASFMNLMAAWMGQGVALIVQMVVRMVFVQYLSKEYLGLSGLFSNILTMFSLVELGVGPAMTFSLYKPLAEQDTEKVKSLMALYKKAYQCIGVVILVLGVVTVPLYPHLINGTPDIPHLNWIYLLFVANTGISYFYSYKRSLISTDQKRYLDHLVHYSFYVLYNLVQIGVLVVTGNYILFLICQVVSTFLENFTLSKLAERMYPYLKEKTIAPLPPEDKRTIRRNVGAMVFHKVGYIVVNSTSSILISTFIGLVATGMYSNYQLIVNALYGIVSQAFGSVTASVGNLNAVEGKEQVRTVFYRIFFLNFWIFGFCAICLYTLFQPFITLWVGAEFLMDPFTVTLMVVSFFVGGMRQAVLTFREATGCYYYDRYKPLAEAGLNLVVSIILVQTIGIAGIVLGNVVTTLFVSTWVEPYVLYKHVLQAPLRHYFLRYGRYTLVVILSGVLVQFLVQFITGNIYLVFLGRLVVCLLVPNLVFLLCFFKTEEFRYFWQLVLRAKQVVTAKLFHKS